MNAYFVTTRKPIRVFQEVIAEWARYEMEMTCGFAYCNSRGQARSLFTNQYDLDFTHPLHIQKVAVIECETPHYTPTYEYGEQDLPPGKINWDIVPGIEHYA